MSYGSLGIGGFLIVARITALLLFAHPAQDSSFTCRALLDHLKGKIETDYAGYVLEVRNTPRKSSYGQLVSKLDARADSTAAVACYPVLDAFVAWFDDPHLFVFQSARLDTAESRRRAQLVVHRTLDEAGARRYYASAKLLDPIEGIWHDGPTRFAVVRDSSTPGRFEAVMLDSDSTTWRLGDVRAVFLRRAPDRYDGTVSLTNFAVRLQHATLHRRTLLRLSPGMWGKLFPVAPADSGLLDPADVHRPTIVTRGTTVIVSIPSHDPGLRRSLDSLIGVHAQDLRSARLLIVDVRGNEGGSSGMSDGLTPYIASHRHKTGPLDVHRAVMLSSPDQIMYASRAFGSDTSVFARRLVERLRANPGGFTPISDSTTPPESASPDSVVEGPKRVAVLIDRGTVSAGEVVVVRAKRSDRVTVFGEPTTGALDYLSVQIVPIAAGERRWFLGYPTITASADLPRGGMRGKGIPPDVRLDWSHVADPIAEVERRLR